MNGRELGDETRLTKEGRTQKPQTLEYKCRNTMKVVVIDATRTHSSWYCQNGLLLHKFYVLTFK